MLTSSSKHPLVMLKSLFGRSEPTSLFVATTEGNLEIFVEENEFYTLLFKIVDSNCDGGIGGVEGALFLSRSGLSRDILREIWRLGSGGTSKPTLSSAEWPLVCKLVAYAQVNDKVDLPDLIAKPIVPFPDFGFSVIARTELGDAPMVPTASIRITVGSPTVVSSGLTKHTLYTVHTSTSLAYFPIKEMTVQRRYSDFEWLHHRLCVSYPGVLIPRFPEKKMVGNMTSEFIEERQRSLELYVDKVAHHAKLTRSVDLQVFLEASSDGLNAARELITRLEASVIGSDSLLRYVSDGGAKSTALIRADEEFLSACQKSSQSLTMLTAAVNTSNAVLQSRKESGYELSRMGNYLQALGTHERAFASAGSGALAANEARAKDAARLTALASASSVSAPKTAAEQAFAAHAQAESSKTGNSIMDMFNVDFNDPFAAPAPVFVAPVAAKPPPVPGVSGRKGSVGGPESINNAAELLSRVGIEVQSMANRLQDHVDRLDALFFSPIRVEMEKEAEIQAAAERRAQAIDRLQGANGLLQRKRRNYAAIRAQPGGGVGGKAERADAECKEAEKRVEETRVALEGITESLKGDMMRVMKERHYITARRLMEMVKAEATFSRGHHHGWSDILPFISSDPLEIRESYVRACNVVDDGPKAP